MTPTLTRRRLLQLTCTGAALTAMSAVPTSAAAPTPRMSTASRQLLQSMLSAAEPAADANTATRTDLISRQFLGTPYGAHTLVGSSTTPEQLVVELQRVDCFTFADYVEALKRADDQDGFVSALVTVRYKGGDVSFANRKHFLTDWAATSPAVATDVTADLSGAVVRTQKALNAKGSGGTYLPGLPVVAREVVHVPSAAVDADVRSRLRTGDYVGSYATDGGLDVTHVGIFVDSPDGPVVRHASSLEGKVVDTPLAEHLSAIPGIVVLRPAL